MTEFSRYGICEACMSSMNQGICPKCSRDDSSEKVLFVTPDEVRWSRQSIWAGFGDFKNRFKELFKEREVF